MFAWLEEVGHLLYQDATALLNQTKPNYKKYVWTKHVPYVLLILGMSLWTYTHQLLLQSI